MFYSFTVLRIKRLTRRLLSINVTKTKLYRGDVQENEIHILTFKYVSCVGHGYEEFRSSQPNHILVTAVRDRCPHVADILKLLSPQFTVMAVIA